MQYPAQHCQQLVQRLNQQRQAGFFCDCTVRIGEAQFRAHRNVLASFSGYFGTLCRDSFGGSVVLDQTQINASGFEKLLDFIYTGHVSLDSCNVKEILQVAEFLRVEEMVSQCVKNMESIAVLTNPSTEMTVIGECTAINQQACFLPLGDHGNPGKPPEVVSIDIIQSKPKRVILGKKSSQTRKRKKMFAPQRKVQKKIVQYQKDILKSSAVEMFLDANKLATEITEQAVQGHDNSDLQLVSALDNETFLMQDITVQTVTMKPKCAKSQQSCALKDHCMSNIVSIKNIFPLESSEKELDQKYSKKKPACNTCGKHFSEASSLRRHMRIHKGVKPYVCHLCGKAFTQCNQLKTHVRTHTGEKPYQCELCDKGFAQKCQLVFHSRMHHGEEKPYKCDICNLQFATSSNLKIHARKHSGEKPYVCDRCGQRFAQASTLTYHVRRHTGEKPYICDTCGKAFAVSSSLITHARKHTGEKPYTCGICGKSFISSGELNKHFRSHTGERPFVCDVCGSSYTDVKNLKKHKTKTHNGCEKNTHSIAADNSFNDQNSMQKSPLPAPTDLKPSDLSLPLALLLGTEDHQMLLPVTDNQPLSSETLLRSSVTGYSEPQYIFLQQLY
ncbi:myoneurin isoform X1 [Microcaecilia unicolor]|uniref:Myoneurin n=2 Tax=Microcaecilia unicolor TaxID=1415580 RepID=A0A6P7Z052_9AMPH|nr:myoneurin-like isoform X1 [Microcaecilia unicolor]XP_030072722.1 myoneurin isoform X1 [Microcaecilia unicolor]